MSRVPIVYNDYDTWLHRRDPRAKILLFASMALFIYVAPTWEWMLGMLLVGTGIAAIARVSWKWLAVLWGVQMPNVLGMLVFPALQRIAAGQPAMAGSFDFGLKLAFAWMAATAIGASVFTSIRITELTDGFRKLGVPEALCFTVEYVFLLFYLIIGDIFRIADAMKVKGVDLETKNPIRLARAAPNLGIPAVFAVLRRSSTMMAVLKMRGYPLDDVQSSRTPMSFDVGDVALVAGGFGVLGVAAAVNVGLLRVPVLPATG